MAITMQGNWTVRVKSKAASFPQRFQISGSNAANGTYIGDVSAPPIFVTGTQWSINIQSQTANGQPWVDSRQRIGTPTVGETASRPPW